MERPVGDKFKINGCVYVVVEDKGDCWEYGCGKCAIGAHLCGSVLDVTGWCGPIERKDGKSVHFEHFGVDF